MAGRQLLIRIINRKNFSSTKLISPEEMIFAPHFKSVIRFDSKISGPGIPLSFLEVIVVMLVVACLLFKRNIMICTALFSMEKSYDDIFNQIPEIETNYQHFKHLPGMYPFMIESSLAEFIQFGKQDPTEIDCSISTKRY